MSRAGVALLVCALAGVGFVRGKRLAPGKPSVDHTSQWLARSADSLDAALGVIAMMIDSSATLSADSTPRTQRLQIAFAHSRAQYKRLEGAVEFYAPALAASLNSRRQEVDDDDAPPPSTLAPGGFPALETMVWPTLNRDSIARAHVMIDGMRRVVARIRALSGALAPTDAQLIELARLEMTRISTLGIAGFDAQVTHASMSEAAEALDGLRALFASAGPARWPKQHKERIAIDSTLSRASGMLRAHPEFESFNRLLYITAYAEPAAQAIDSLRRVLGLTAIQIPRGWRSDVASVFDSGAFNPRAYAAATAPAPTPELIALGRRLFSETSLSGTGKRSCASCHVPSHAFTDGLVRAVRIDGRGLVARHTPTLLNAGLAPAQFADERSITIEEQIVRVLESKTEMGSSTELATASIARRPEYVAEFSKVFGGAADSAVTGMRLRFAIAAFVRSLVALNSRFDVAMRGDTTRLTSEERQGFTLFMGKAACGTCHFAPLFNGNTPPLYLASDVEVIGTPRSSARPGMLDPDSGRGAIDHLPLHVRAFKTPSVRNTALTAPYMHNGAFATLDEVITFYDHGGGAGAGAPIQNQTLSADSLHLTVPERSAIIAFIRSLTDTTQINASNAATSTTNTLLTPARNRERPIASGVSGTAQRLAQRLAQRTQR